MLNYLTLNKLYRGAPNRVYRKNAIIFDCHEQAQGLYYISEGIVKSTVTSGNGSEYIVSTLGAGDLVPLVGYFLGPNRSEIYTAVTDVHVRWRWREEIDIFCNQHPDALREIIRVVMGAMACRINTLSIGPSEQRVLLRIQELAGRFGEVDGGGVAITVTQQELADAVNLSRESVSGILNRLEAQQIVKLERNRLTIQVAKVDHAIALEL